MPGQVLSSQRWHYLLQVGLAAGVYVAVGQLGLSMRFVPPDLSPVWPLAGFSLALVLLFGPRLWPGLLIGPLVLGALTGAPWSATLSAALAGTVEALLGFYLLGCLGFQNSLRRFRDVVGLMGLAAGAAAMCGAALGTLANCLLEPRVWNTFGTSWERWWLEDAAGVLIVTPLLLTWRPSPALATKSQRIVEARLILALLVTINLVLFRGHLLATTGGSNSMIYLVLPFVIWAAIQYCPPGAAAATLVVTSLVLWKAAQGLGPFSMINPLASLLLWLAFAWLAAGIGLGLATVLARHRQVYHVLAESEERFHGIFDFSAIGITLTALDGHILRANRAWREMLGYEDQELAGLAIQDITFPDDQEETRLALQQLLAGKIPTFQQEKRYRHRGGELIWSQVNVSLVRDEEETPLYFIYQVQNITERRWREEALREKQELLESIINHIPHGVFWKDRQGVYLGCNDNTARDAGMGCPENMIGKTDYDLAESRAEADFYAQTDHQVIASGKPLLNIEETQLRLGGQQATLLVSKVPFRGADSQVIGVLGIYTDITERKRMQVALQQSEERFQAFMDHTPALAFIKDEAGRYVYGNRAWAAQFREGVSSLLGKTDADLWPTASARFLQEGDRVALESQLVIERAEMAISSHGTVRHWMVLKFPVKDPSGRRLVGGIALNITDWKQAEEALRQSEESYRPMFEANPHPMWVCDAVTLEFLAVNDAAVAHYGYSRTEFLAMTLEDIRPSEDLPLVHQHIANQAAPPPSGPRIWKHRRKDGSLIDVEIMSHELWFSGRRAKLTLAMDVTERKRAEEALRENEERYRSLVENLNDVVYIEDVHGNLTYVSPAIERISSYTAEDLTGQPFFRFVHPDDLAGLQASFERTLMGKLEPLEFRVMDKGGAVRWVRTFSRPQFERGKLVSLVGVLTDVTDRKLAEEALAFEQHLLRTLVDNIADSIYFKDPSGRFIRINKAKAQRCGLSDPTQAVGKTDFYYFADERAQESYHDEEEVMRTGQPLLAKEEKIVWQDGRVTWVLASKFPLRDRWGNIEGTFGISTDITERKQAEEALRHSEQRFRSLVETARDIIFTVSPDGIVQSLSPAFTAITGWPCSDWLGRPFAHLVHPEDVYLVQELFYCLLQSEALPSLEVRALRNTGDFVSLEVTVTPQWQGGGLVWVLGIARDVTERKRLEDQLRQAQKMEAVGQLAGGVAHDFNNLLTIISGYSSLLLGGQFPADLSQGALEEIKNAADRAASLTRQLLAFSRKQVLAPIVLDLNQVVTNMEKMLRRLIGEDIDLVTGLDPELQRVKADPGQIEQVLMNLAVNARDAMPQGGKITLGTSNLQVPESFAPTVEGISPGPYAKLTVTDTGCGMDEYTRAHLFEPFFTTKEIGKGTGLGLATVYGIIKQSGGHIEVHSKAGRGTTFHIFLPAFHEPLARPTNGAESALGPRGTETVLLVEDEEAVRGLVREVLGKSGYQVLEARNGVEGLRICEQHDATIHLVVTDVVMPEMSGRELLQRIALLRPATRFLYMSGYTDDALVRQGIQTEGTGFLQKPFTPAKLALKVREILDQ